MQQALVANHLADWIADCCAAAVRLMQDDSGDCTLTNLGMWFVLVTMTPSHDGANTE